MANYTFRCVKCGEFTLWYQGMRGNKREAYCPDCNTLSKRLFKPPITFRLDSRVKNRIESGMEPKIVKREDMPQNRKKRPNAARPWQAGHS
ncbi:FmdB family zinc ribbon protein [Virgibacillus alimentarius]|uniref:FmdB family regulatory protein n=1 Tax=Virgibacillus alimentarius TaxID=698769 RepID=A0ABS4SBT6_9BACI|nr:MULTISPECIES: zinc ribbon domain-containing protein [Virgibacillus]MBP2258928.1 putative FmdB family regulatory protein [Virgibacillus alimentarius]HLR69381.1 zinc ribbon domain-containing protein [Virgibacillus sp.]